MDLRWSHQFKLGAASAGDSPGVAIGLDAFNVTNRVNFNNPVGNLSSPFFGQSISARPPRRVQLSASLTF